MKKLFLTLILLLLMTFLLTDVSAQDANIDNMNNEELTTLLMQIMQKLESKEEPGEASEPTSTPTPIPTATPLPELRDDTAELEALLIQIMQKLQQDGEAAEIKSEDPDGTIIPVSEQEDGPKYSIWENKKLIIEGLPSYMFIQPTRESKPERPEKHENGTTEGSNNGGEDDSHGFVWDDDSEYCPPPFHWVCYPDRCVCASPNG